MDKINPEHRAIIRRYLLDLVARLDLPTDDHNKRCKNCRFYDFGFCKMAAKKIPEEIMNSGCEAWEYDALPF